LETKRKGEIDMLDLTNIFQEGALREWTKRVDVEDTVGNASQP
jgi:hypothetical protein